MASRRAKLLVTSAVCGGALVMAGQRFVARAQDVVGQSPPTKDAPAVRAAEGSGAGQQPAQARSQSQPAATTPAAVNPTRVAGWPFERLGRQVAASPMPSEDEWRQTAAQFAQISPARWQVYEQVLTKPGRRDRAKRFLYARYLELRELQRTNPAAYQAKIEQVKFEDDVFRLDTAIRGASSPAEAEPLRAELHDRVMERVKREQADREQRLRQLQERLDREKAALETAKGRAEQITENRSNNMRRNSERFRNWATGQPANPDAGASRPNPNTRQNRPAPPANGSND